MSEHIVTRILTESVNFVFPYCAERVTKSTTQSTVGGLVVKKSTVLDRCQSPPFFMNENIIGKCFRGGSFFSNKSKNFTSDTNRQQHTTTHNTQQRRQHQRQRRRHNTAQHHATTQRHSTRYPPHTNTRNCEQTNKHTSTTTNTSTTTTTANNKTHSTSNNRQPTKPNNSKSNSNGSNSSNSHRNRNNGHERRGSSLPRVPFDTKFFASLHDDRLRSNTDKETTADKAKHDEHGDADRKRGKCQVQKTRRQDTLNTHRTREQRRVPQVLGL